MFGVTVKLVLADLTLPLDGPVNVKLVAATYGVAEFEADDSEELPTTFVARTVNVYGVPLVRPLTTIGEDEPVLAIEPGVDIARYCVIAEPPSDDGAEKVTDALVFPGVAVPTTGALGTTAFAVYVSADGLLRPTPFVMVSVIVPDVNGVIVNVCADAELLNVKMVGDKPAEPVPDGVMVIVPLIATSGVTVKLVDAELTLPDPGPLKDAVKYGLTEYVTALNQPELEDQFVTTV